VNDHGVKVVVSHHFPSWQVGVWLVRKQWFDGVPVTQVAQSADLVWEPHDEAAMLDRPSLLLPDEFGRALLDELVTHYGGHSDVRSLRRDYDAERKRVDTLTDAIIKVASR
jgi:hypothetical protein